MEDGRAREKLIFKKFFKYHNYDQPTVNCLKNNFKNRLKIYFCMTLLHVCVWDRPYIRSYRETKFVARTADTWCANIMLVFRKEKKNFLKY